MKLILPDYGFEYSASNDGIKAQGQIFDSETDKLLYLAILENLQIDYKNAPINIADSDYLHQRIQYVINLNRYLKIQTDDDMSIRQNVEAFDSNQLRKISLANPIFGVYQDTTDLQ
jgi:hypothetical protein